MNIYEEHTVRLTVDQIVDLMGACLDYSLICEDKGMPLTAQNVRDLFDSFNRIICRVFGNKENENAKEIEVK